ncbi:MAG: AbrB family transcriptional regulator [Kurthia sp.]|nr:AbrB family transcriptional regulator [Candidatus Kurthia equi]
MKEKGLKLLFTLGVAWIGGLLFSKLSIPVPWLLGPIAFVLIGSTIKRSLFYWPKQIKSVGMIVIGYTIGLALTKDAVTAIGHQLPYMFGMTMLLILLSAAVAFLVSKVSNTNYPTALLASIPGGMTQIILMAEEMKGVNLTIVTVTQTIRLMLIVIGMPLILAGLGESSAAQNVSNAIQPHINYPTVIVLILCVIFSFLGKKIKFPTAFLLVPALVTAIAQGFGMQAVDLPPSTLQFAQVLIGINIGLMMRPGELENKTKTLSLAFFSGMLIFITAMFLGIFFAEINNFDLPTALLSLAPGGMDQMGAIAHAIHADLSMVAGYQVFRAFFILFIIQPVLSYILQKKGLISK